MKTKAKIVERLLEEKHITAEEAVVLLREVEYIDPNPVIGPGIIPICPAPNFPNPFEITGDEEMVPYGEICSCNPKNGGSGICGCIMANQLVPKNSKYKGYSNITTTGDDIKIEKRDCPNGPVCYCDGSCKNNG